MSKDKALEKPRLFNNLPVSTQTVMVYINCSFNLDNIYERLPVEEYDGTPLKKVKGEHGKIYQLKGGPGRIRGAPSKKGNFRNQVTAYIYVVDKMITIKVFPTGKLHMTGCKRLEHQQKAVELLLGLIRKEHMPDSPTYEMETPGPLVATLEVVMTNVDFHLDFEIDQIKLDSICQEDDIDFYTIYETPVNTSVNIKLDYPEPKNKKYHQVVVDGPADNPVVTLTTTSECLKARVGTTRTHTFLVFSNKVIQSGRYYDSEMEPAYQKFTDFIKKNRESIELHFHEKRFDMSKLRGFKLKDPLQIKSAIGLKNKILVGK